MATRTLAQLLTGTRQIANVENSAFVTDPELTDRINEAVGELYDLFVSTYENYYIKPFGFSLAGGNNGNSVSLAAFPGGFYKDSTLEKDPGTSNMRIVSRLGAFNERGGMHGRVYDIIDSNPQTLFVYPPELASGNYRLLYTPDPPVLATAAPGPQVDLDPTLTKFYRYVQYRAAIDVHRKRQKTMEANELAGVEENPQPGTLAWEKRRVLTMAHNKMFAPQQVPMRTRSQGIFDPDDMP